MKLKDLAGMRFGNLTVLSLCSRRTKRGQARWLVRCDCGVEKEVTGVDLSTGNTKSCGCKKGFRIKDLKNKRFGYLVAKEIINGRRKHGEVIWLCKCDCGKQVEIGSGPLCTGNTKSCGCVRWLLKDLVGKRFGKLTVKQLVEGETRNGSVVWLCECDCGKQRMVASTYLIRGHTRCCGCNKGILISKAKIQHGLTGTPTYISWQAMKQRCVLDEYYIKHNISYDPRWNNFTSFLNDMGKAPFGFSLDRIDPNGNYNKENCRWASREKQANNKRASRMLDYNGKIQSTSQWARALGIRIATLLSRLRKGWSVERVLTTEVRSHAGLKNSKNRKHGMTNTRAYSIWSGMKARCKRHPIYRREGITIDPRWFDFLVFYNEMGAPPKGMSLDRIDNKKGYTRDNCRWATSKEQGNNKRSNVFLEHDNKRMTVAEWETQLGLRRGIVTSRLRAGWSIERALSIRPKS